MAFGKIEAGGARRTSDPEALAGAWPDEGSLHQVVIEGRDPRSIAVTASTSTPGQVIGHGGGTASAIRDRLRRAVDGTSVELHVLEKAAPVEREASMDEEDPLGGEAILDASSPARDLVPDLLGMALVDAVAKGQSSGSSLATGGPDGAPISSA